MATIDDLLAAIDRLHKENREDHKGIFDSVVRNSERLSGLEEWKTTHVKGHALLWTILGVAATGVGVIAGLVLR